MLLALTLLAAVALWWTAKSRGGLGAVVAALPRQRIAGWAALGIAGAMMLHGNLILAALFALGGLWAVEGPEGAGRRLKGFLPGRTRTAPAAAARRIRTRLIVMTVAEDGTMSAGRICSGPEAGAHLDRMDLPALARLRALCRAEDPQGAGLLEAYLDCRAPGWRIHAEGDGDPWPGGPAKPGAMSQQEAYEVLGLERGAATEQIRTAHRTLMKRAHPDQGGSAEGAARLNAARDRLLNRHR